MKLLDLVRDDIHNKHHSVRTEQAYVELIRQSIKFHGKYHPKDMGEKGITQHLSHMASELKVTSSTQNQALSPIVFFNKQGLGIKLGGFVRRKRLLEPERSLVEVK